MPSRLHFGQSFTLLTKLKIFSSNSYPQSEHFN
nr:MAG TPA: hypothetical protein [Caudoviricetes sp.]